MNFIFLITLLTFTWTSIVQALPFSDDIESHQGNIGRAAHSMVNSGTLKSLGTDMTLAALVGGGKPSTFAGHLAQQSVKAVSRMDFVRQVTFFLVRKRILQI